MTPRLDPKSTAGNPPRAERHVPLIVVGAGPAGLAAALEAAGHGVETMLIDEHPVAGALMGLDVPYHFGQRMNAAVQNKARLVERLVETNPGIAEAFERGIDVQLGVYAWGAFVRGPSLGTLARPMLGLADEERSWMVSFDRLILATGARDLGMAFAGWDKPGVMGAQAALALMERYRAFEGRRLVVLGSGALGLRTALTALDHGLTVAAIVEVGSEVRGPSNLADRLTARGVAILTDHTVKQALGQSEVEGVTLVRLDAKQEPIAGSAVEIACDTVIMAIGKVPTVELLDTLGCKLAFVSELGGYVPVLDEAGLDEAGLDEAGLDEAGLDEAGLDGAGQTTVPAVHAVGDAAGLYDAKTLDPAIAVAEGRRAAISAAQALGAALGAAERAPPLPAVPAGPSGEVHSHYQTWLRAAIAAGGWDVNICQCEEVTRRELVEVQPPRYLNWGASQMRGRNLDTLLRDGPVNPDQIKRMTRAGMGTCQGRRCREQVQMLLALAAKVPVDQVPLASYRAPVRPLPMTVLWPHDETDAMRATWEAWFGIPTQFSPHWECELVSPAVTGLDLPATSEHAIGVTDATAVRGGTEGKP